MDVRKKLVELLQDENNPVWRWLPNNMAMMQLVDYLISNGVTVQECPVLGYIPNPAQTRAVIDKTDGPWEPKGGYGGAGHYEDVIQGQHDGVIIDNDRGSQQNKKI